MKRLMFLLLFMLPASKISFSQEHNIHPVKYIFDPNANAKDDLNNAILTAGKQHKHVFILVGGDWSQSCMEFIETLTKDQVQKSLFENFVFLKINFSPDNKNEEVRNLLECPKYDGYPVIVVLDEHGKKVVVQTADEFRLAPHVYSTTKVAKSLHAWATLETKI